MRTAFLFPGFGAYYAAPFAGWPLARDVAESVAAEVDTIAASYDLPQVAPSLLQAEDRSPGAAFPPDSDVRALEIFAAEITCYRLLREQAGITPDVLCGHSLGEYAALVAAEGLSLPEGVRLLCERIRTLRQHRVPEGGMLAVRLSPREARRLTREEPTTVIAAVNGTRQVVLSGPSASLDRLHQLLAARGRTATRLRTGPTPHHHPLLTDAYRHHAAAVRRTPAWALRHRVHSPVLGRSYLPCDDLAQALALQMVLPVHFLEALVDLCDDGVGVFVECGPRRTLSGLVESAAPQALALAPFRTRVTRNRLHSGLIGTERPAEEETWSPTAMS
ncbi:acyltransferase domain-containing protein [Streptomyces sp. TRM 70351]|uniref:ACP S-malonyltransferase n=1 Tax=Streptomyces sp. TRM 70351 TaxID=3116552 RepID=UPI002E7BC109|nr:acyltransferase domain-containing protein [Streptomyces sp. TRM 70351]MEE1928885.1 acyltransferase domain-containing protein [Streptomyces sp. TRM 70351]